MLVPSTSSARRRWLPLATALACASFALVAPGAAAAPPVGPDAAAATPADPISVFPAPGTTTVNPQSQISFRGTPTPPELQVVGSATGSHPGTWVAHSDGDGASFVPASAFAPGETVTVSSSLPVEGDADGTFTYTVAEPVTDQPVPMPETAPPSAGESTDDVSAAAVDGPRFRSRPDLRPPVVEVVKDEQLPRASGLLLAGTVFPTPRSDVGVLLYDDTGQPVYFKPTAPYVHPAPMRIDYRGTDALAWFEGTSPGYGMFTGKWAVMDEAYQRIGTISAGNGYSLDNHDLVVSPDGSRALLVIYSPLRMDLSRYGGSPTATVVEGVVQEIDLATGAVTFEWHSLGSGDFPVTDTYMNLADPSGVVDYFHINSAAYDTDGDVLVSARHVSVGAEIDVPTGRTQWRLGGRRSTFAFPDPEDRPLFPHDARRRADGTISLYDNGVGRGYGRSATWRLDEVARTAVIDKEWRHAPDLFGPIVGSSRATDAGTELVSFGNAGVATEYGAQNRVAFQASMVVEQGRECTRGAIGTSDACPATYRTTREAAWDGRPAEPPALALDRAGDDVTAFASWNGATGVATWALLAGSDPSALREVAVVDRTGFETTIPATVTAEDSVFVVEARDATGAALGRSVSDPIASKYAEAGMAALIGTPVGDRQVVGTGQAQRYTRGLIAWSPGTGVHAVHGAILGRYDALGGPGGRLGFPTSDELAVGDGRGRVSTFGRGSIYWTAQTGAHEVRGQVLAKYLITDGPGGVLGYPTSGETAAPGGTGHYNRFERGSAWTRGGTAYELHGAIHALWMALGGVLGTLGFPTTDEEPTRDGVGRLNHFVGGSIYWTPATGAQHVWGDILTEWARAGYHAGFLGYPVTGERSTPDGTGRFNHFQRGSMYWTPGTGAREVRGAIRDLWARLGWERSHLGYPVTHESVTPDRVGRYNHFTGGSVYWTPATGAREVRGAIREQWARAGWERSVLRYPTSDEYDVPGGRRSDFQGGSITWDRATGRTTTVLR